MSNNLTFLLKVSEKNTKIPYIYFQALSICGDLKLDFKHSFTNLPTYLAPNKVHGHEC